MNNETGSCSTTATSCAPTACATTGGGKSCCGRAALAALLGGIVMFAWISVSWMLLPWHQDHARGFKDEAAVATAIAGSAAQGSGLYVIPYTAMGKEEQKTTKPYAYVNVVAEGVDLKSAMNVSLAEDLVLCIFLAGLLACILRKKPDGCCPVALSAKIGLLAGLASYLPNYIWYHFPLGYTVVGVVETLIGFILAGLVIAKLLRQKIGCSKSACGTTPGNTPVNPPTINPS